MILRHKTKMGTHRKKTNLIKELNDCKTLDELKLVWEKNKHLHSAEAFCKAKENKKEKLLKNGK